MKKRKNILLITLITIISLLGVNNVKADSTVLYNDGVFIINEADADRDYNLSKHGAIIKEYEPLSNENTYRFVNADEVLWKDNVRNIKKVVIGQEIKPTSTAYWFNDAVNLYNANFSNMDTSDVEDMQYMFNNSGSSISSINQAKFSITGLGWWNTSKVTNMKSMFSGAGSDAIFFDIAYNAFDSWDTSKVTDMSHMFSLTAFGSKEFEINLSNWDTSSVTDMAGMFRASGTSGSNWDIGDISNWNTSQVTDMSYMFADAAGDSESWNIGSLSNWDTSSVINMKGMFEGVASNNVSTFSLGDLSNWDTSKVNNMEEMFHNTAINATTFESIGKLTIHKNCEYTGIVNGAKSFTGDLVFEKGLSTIAGENGHFANAATTEGSTINLYFLNDEGMLTDNLMLYGPNGTYSKGNIYAYHRINTKTISNGYVEIYINGEKSTDLQAKNGDTVKVVYTPKKNYKFVNYVVKDTAGKEQLATGLNDSSFIMPEKPINIYDNTLIILTSSNIKVTGIVNKVYNGKAQTQEKVVVTTGGTTFALKKDYTVTYKNNKNIGTASVIITGTGKYTGSVTKTFKINPAKIKIKKLTTKKGQFSIIYNTTSGGVYYEAAYNMKGNKKIYYAKKTVPKAITIKKLKSKKYYYTKIRACKKVGATTYCGAWSPVKSIKVK